LAADSHGLGAAPMSCPVTGFPFMKIELSAVPTVIQ